MPWGIKNSSQKRKWRGSYTKPQSENNTSFMEKFSVRNIT
jgi:hypothetical protein